MTVAHKKETTVSENGKEIHMNNVAKMIVGFAEILADAASLQLWDLEMQNHRNMDKPTPVRRFINANNFHDGLASVTAFVCDFVVHNEERLSLLLDQKGYGWKLAGIDLYGAVFCDRTYTNRKQFGPSVATNARWMIAHDLVVAIWEQYSVKAYWNADGYFVFEWSRK